jgi:hypothetical protein
VEGRDDLFRYFASALLVILLLFGAGMVVAVLFGNEPLAAKMVNVFSGMFSGVLGLGSGYLLGTKRTGGKDDDA